MNKNIDEFIDEITTNFAELFVEAFFLRYINVYSKDELLKNIKITNKMLNKKINKNFMNKLNNIDF